MFAFPFFGVVWSLRSLTSGSAGLFEALVLEEGADFDVVLGEASEALIVGFLLRLEVRVPFGDSSFGVSTDGLEFRAEVEILTKRKIKTLRYDNVGKTLLKS